jgi:hypothetical protein
MSKVIHEEWCPGNGTKYELMLVTTESHTVVVWVNRGMGGLATKVNATSLLHYTYFAEKLGHNVDADIGAILAWLSIHGIRVAMPPDMREDGLHEFREVKRQTREAVLAY